MKTTSGQDALTTRPAHTPGPWFQSHSETRDGGYSTEVYDALGKTIAILAWYSVDLGNGAVGTARESNALLIATTPDLAALLLESRESIGGDWRERRDEILKEAGLL